MPVENGDRVRVDNLEEVTIELTREVSTLGGVLHTHMDQVAADKIEAKRENVERYRGMMDKFDTTLSVAQDNKAQLGILVAVAEKKEQWFGPMNGKTKAKVAGAGAFGLGGIYILVEAIDKVVEFFKGLQ